MLEHVAANQTRFVAPGLSADARGVAVGRFIVVLLPALDRVVGLFRGLSEQMSIDELLSSLRIVQVRTPLASRELLVQLPATNSNAADSMAAVARLVGGLTFTGSSKHFVKYRDTRSPLGYDVDGLHSGPGDFVLYGDGFVQVYTHERVLSFEQLATTLSLQRQRDDHFYDGESALLRTARGLYQPVLGYLHRNAVECSAAAAESVRAASRETERFFLIRCDNLPQRMVDLFRRTPGVEVYRMKSENVAVQLGYRHPFELSSCSSVFDPKHFFLFSGERDSLETLDAEPQFVAAAALVQLAGVRELQQQTLRPELPEEAEVPLKLAPTSGAQPHLTASRIPLQEAGRLKKLIYLLPPAVLSGYQLCATATHLYLYCDKGIDYVPLGDMFWEFAPGVMVPQGCSLLPRVHPDVLLDHLGGRGKNQLFFFPRDGSGPLSFSRQSFAPLGRAALAEVELEAPQNQTLPRDADHAALEIVNDPLGAFPLWGFTAIAPGANRQMAEALPQTSNRLGHREPAAQSRDEDDGR
jgi:hypothetical protein